MMIKGKRKNEGKSLADALFLSGMLIQPLLLSSSARTMMITPMYSIQLSTYMCTHTRTILTSNIIVHQISGLLPHINIQDTTLHHVCCCSRDGTDEKYKYVHIYIHSKHTILMYYVH